MTCPLDGMPLNWTGASRTEWGKMLYEYRNTYGHGGWYVQQ
jgi:hypothetical protein